MELRSGRAALLASLFGRAVAASALGTICGVAAFAALDLMVDWSSPERPAGVFVWLAFLALGGFPFAFVGLLLGGGPLTFLLRGFAASRWLLAIAAGLGGAFGWTVLALLDFATLDPLQIVGALIGGFTGLFWAAYARAPILRLQETRFDDTP